MAGTAERRPLKGGRVIVIGDVMTDVIVRPEGPLVRGSDRRAAITMRPGGAGANQAAWLAHLGVPVTLVAKIGADDRERQEAVARSRGITPAFAIDHDMPSGMLVSIIDPDGERSFLTARGANDCLAREDLPEALLDGAALLQVSGYALVAEDARRAVLGFMAAAKRRDVALSVDPASTAFLEEMGPENFLRWTAGCDLCFPNEAEAAVLAGTPDSTAQRERLSAIYGLTVLKRGAAGAEAFGKAGRHAPATPSPAIGLVDTTGAGDAFLAGFLSAWLAGEPIPTCIQRGAAAGALAAGILGGQPPLAARAIGYGNAS